MRARAACTCVCVQIYETTWVSISHGVAVPTKFRCGLVATTDTDEVLPDMADATSETLHLSSGMLQQRPMAEVGSRAVCALLCNYFPPTAMGRTDSARDEQRCPPATTARHVYSFQSQPLALSHCSTSRCPFEATSLQEPHSWFSSPHSQLFARAHCSTERCPFRAAAWHVPSSQSQPISLNHCSTASFPPTTAW